MDHKRGFPAVTPPALHTYSFHYQKRAHLPIEKKIDLLERTQEKKREIVRILKEKSGTNKKDVEPST